MKNGFVARCVLLSSVLVLGGCSDFIDGLFDTDDNEAPDVLTTRQCSAFYHPEFTSWVPEEAEGNIISFSDASGATALFTGGALVRSDAFSINILDSDDECRLLAQRSYTSSSPYPQIDYQYAHVDEVNSGIESEPLALALTFKTDEGETLPLQFHVNLNDSPEVSGINHLFETQYYPSYTIGINNYSDVISQSVVEALEQIYVGLDASAEQHITGVVIARGVGLVQFELVDGRVFNRNL